MPGSHARLIGVTLLAALAAASAVRADDYFEQKKRELAIQAQKTVADVISALEASRTLEKKDAGQAKTLLLQSLLDVNDSASLDEKQRADLQKRLRARLAEVEATLREQNVTGNFKSKQAADKAAREEKERMDLAKLQGQQKSPYDLAKDRIDGTKKVVDAYGDIKKATEKGVTDIGLETAKTASKMTEERITEYFIKKSEMRKNNKLTKEEVALLKALNSTISVDFDKNALKEVMEYMSEKTGLNIFIDQASMKEAGVEYDSPITFKAKKVTVRTVLKKVFADLGMTYVIREAAIQVITPDRAKDYLVTRAYPVQDLVAPFDMRWGPYANRVQMMQKANQLMQMIVSMVEPASWQGVGERGYGTISYNEATMSIIVRHTAEMHYMLGGGLGR
jgi:hypothetical protein